MTSKLLFHNFYVKFFEKLTSFVGWNIVESNEGIIIVQRGYVRSMLKEYAKEIANGVATPLHRFAGVTPAHDKELLLNTTEHNKYRSMIGSLLYLAICYRTDISFSVAVRGPCQAHSTLNRRNGRLRSQIPSL